jgi:hypothetical protein
MRWSEEDLKMVQERINNGRNKNHPSISPDHMEQTTRHEPLGKKKVSRLGSPCSIHIHSKRHRLSDADGISGKAVIDGLVHAGLLQDDSPEYVKEVTYSQEKINRKENEKTILTIKWGEECRSK